MGIFGARRSSVELEEAAAERRRRFMETFGNMSADGHGQPLEESAVLDHSTSFDLHNVSSKPTIVDDKDFVKPAPLWTEAEESERRLNAGSFKELTTSESMRRQKFNDFFDKIPADNVQGPIPDRRSLDHCRFENMPSRPPVDPMVDPEQKKKDNLVWHDYSEVKLTPHPEVHDKKHMQRMETFSALYSDIACNEHYTAVH